ncbi:MAG: lipopolysaccharide heptosyltransferase I [Candidatus Aminicenantes bacterium]|nr:lipopolysaccharide heptosyltransferase I [Candidatus Aminicenantes bacterium]
MDKFLIIRLSSLGDIIHTLPAFAALRNYFPEAEISWLVQDKGKEILDFVPGIDRTIVLPQKKWSITSKYFWSEFLHVVREISNKDQIALDFQGLFKSGLFTYLSKAKTRIGFHKNNLRESGASIFYTSHLDPISEKMHIISKNLKLLTKVGIQQEKFEFPIQIPEDLSKSVLEKIKILGYREPNRLVILNVGAAWETKRWFSDRWIELIRILNKEYLDLFFLILWGTDEERALAEDIHAQTNTPITPTLSLKEVMALIKEADLLISGDTFALQIACALSRPVVGLFGPTSPKRNGPFCEQDSVAFQEMDCSHCYKRKCSNLECLKKITPKEVAALSLQRLDKHA